MSLPERSSACPFKAKTLSCFAVKIAARGYSILENAGDLGSVPSFVAAVGIYHCLGATVLLLLLELRGATSVATLIGYSVVQIPAS